MAVFPHAVRISFFASLFLWLECLQMGQPLNNASVLPHTKTETKEMEDYSAAGYPKHSGSRTTGGGDRTKAHYEYNTKINSTAGYMADSVSSNAFGAATSEGSTKQHCDTMYLTGMQGKISWDNENSQGDCSWIISVNSSHGLVVKVDEALLTSEDGQNDVTLLVYRGTEAKRHMEVKRLTGHLPTVVHDTRKMKLDPAYLIFGYPENDDDKKVFLPASVFLIHGNQALIRVVPNRKTMPKTQEKFQEKFPDHPTNSNKNTKTKSAIAGDPLSPNESFSVTKTISPTAPRRSGANSVSDSERRRKTAKKANKPSGQRLSLTYTSVPLTTMPPQVTKSRYNCSKPYVVPEFFKCDFGWQCLNGEDEETWPCLYNLGCKKGQFLYVYSDCMAVRFPRRPVSHITARQGCGRSADSDPSTTLSAPPTSDSAPPITAFNPPVSDFDPATTDSAPPVTSFDRPVSDFDPSINNSAPHITDSPSPITELVPPVSGSNPPNDDLEQLMAATYRTFSDSAPPASDYDSPISDYDSPNSDFVQTISHLDPPIADSAPSISNVDSASADSDAHVPEFDPPVYEFSSPLSEFDPLMNPMQQKLMARIALLSGYDGVVLEMYRVRTKFPGLNHLYRFLWETRSWTPSMRVVYGEPDPGLEDPILRCGVLRGSPWPHIQPVSCAEEGWYVYACSQHPFFYVPSWRRVQHEKVLEIPDKFPMRQCSNGSFTASFLPCPDQAEGAQRELEEVLPTFACKNGITVHYSLACDGFDDCGDNSDEESCAILLDTVHERSITDLFLVCSRQTEAYPAAKRCDGSPDCHDSSDEDDCLVCRSRTVYCEGFGCLPYSYTAKGLCPSNKTFDRDKECFQEWELDEQASILSEVGMQNAQSFENADVQGLQKKQTGFSELEIQRTRFENADAWRFEKSQTGFSFLETQRSRGNLSNFRSTYTTTFRNAENSTLGMRAQNLLPKAGGPVPEYLNFNSQIYPQSATHCISTKPRPLSLRSELNEEQAILDLDGYGSAIIRKRGDGTRCPETHIECRFGLCIPIYLLNNGQVDCPFDGDEELDSPDYCPGYYRCYRHKICLHNDHLCDGIYQCPLKDDERYCDLTSPPGCVRHGHALTCNQTFPASQWESLANLRYLDMSQVSVNNSWLAGVENVLFLLFLNLSSCSLDTLALEHAYLDHLRVLDLSYNNLTSLSSVKFGSSAYLTHLNLSHNPVLRQITDKDFSSFIQTHVRIRSLALKNTSIVDIEPGSFSSLRELSVLDLRDNKIKSFHENMFSGLDNLGQLYADEYRLCCLYFYKTSPFNPVPPSAQLSGGQHRATWAKSGCIAPEDELSSCDDLLRSDFFRGFLWTLSTMALTGNTGVLVYRIFLESVSTSAGFRVLVANLCLADFLMGAYLVMVGSADGVYRGRYLWERETWTRSSYCRTAGFLALLSSEVSAFIICLITLDRFLALRAVLSRHVRLSVRSAGVACGAIWVVGLILATIPLLPLTSHWEFYSQNGICLPLPITRQSFAGQHYAFFVFIVLNFVLFVFTGIGQLLILKLIHNTPDAGRTGRRQQEMAIARRLFLIVFSDFCCWFPIGLMGLMAARGTPVPSVVNVWSAIFVLPLNSALNPFLYTLNMLMEKWQKRRFMERTQVMFNRLDSEMVSWPPEKVEDILKRAQRLLKQRDREPVEGSHPD